MSELEKRVEEITQEAKHEKLFDSDSPYVDQVELLLIRKIAEIQLKLEALENPKPSFSFGGMAIDVPIKIDSEK